MGFLFDFHVQYVDHNPSALLASLEPGTLYTVNVSCTLADNWAHGIGYWSDSVGIDFRTLEAGTLCLHDSVHAECVMNAAMLWTPS